LIEIYLINLEHALKLLVMLHTFELTHI
jgi:hypothetical protein